MGEMKRLLWLIVAMGIIALVIIGLVNFDLFISIWAKAIIVALVVGVFITIVVRVTRVIK